MDKLILIDGNSLLNRAFYAMRVFTTQAGLPTNGIFGFIKFILKIIEDEQPQALVCTFDLKAPTFRHKMYAEYKGTRKPMPEELIVQVPILKELLRSMNVCIVEKEGYEADDLIGTISRKFPNVAVQIYTGDRDSYQLVKKNVSVYFTKKGVSELDRLTIENFYDKIGLTPEQIIEEKALMGDSSDNIPGVKGIGPKSAVELLKKYQTLDGVYENISAISPKLKEKLIEGKEDAYLSHTLATIDTNVPLDLTFEQCLLKTPFPMEARNACLKLEFRSLVNSPIFEQGNKTSVQTVVGTGIDTFIQENQTAQELAFVIDENGVHICSSGKEYIFNLKLTLLDAGFFFQELKPLFEFIFVSSKRVYVADVKAVCHRLNDVGISPTCALEDVSLMRYLSDSNRRTQEAKDFVNDYDLPPENSAYALLLASRESEQKMKGTPEETLYRDLELPLENVLYDMERTGICIDEGKFPEFSEKYNRELKELSQKIFDLAGGETFNLKSPFKLSEILFEKLGYSAKGIKKNIRGGYSTSAEVLEKLAEEHEIARLILRYREIQKLQSTYIDGIRPLAVNGIVHTTYNQMMTTTGRLSSANPNLQNIPVRKEEGRELRKLFIPRKGNVFIDADYSQIELRLLAHFSNCKPLISAFNEGKDIHSTTAAQIFGVPMEEVTPLMRRKAKAVNFGLIYGMTSFGLAKDVGISNEEAQSYIEKYFQTYTDVKEYMEDNVKKAKENGYVTTILGRKRYIPELKDNNYYTRSFGERAAMNMPLQGSSADIIKLAMLNVHDRLKKEGLETKIVLQVHDELVLDCPFNEQERATTLLKEEMESAISLKVPLVAEVAFGENWYEAK